MTVVFFAVCHDPVHGSQSEGAVVWCGPAIKAFPVYGSLLDRPSVCRSLSKWGAETRSIDMSWAPLCLLLAAWCVTFRSRRAVARREHRFAAFRQCTREATASVLQTVAHPSQPAKAAGGRQPGRPPGRAQAPARRAGEQQERRAWLPRCSYLREASQQGGGGHD
jgi:hypothetical protein